MTDDELDRCYTALNQSLAEVGSDKALLLLATLSLSLIVRERDAKIVLELISQAGELART